MNLGRWRFIAVMFLAAIPAMGAGQAIASGPITVGRLTLTPCIAVFGGYCGSITRPLDRSGTLPGRVTVGFEFYPHQNASLPYLGVILAQEGGPGYSTTGSRDGYVRMLTPLRDQRDILLIDKRGTGRSSPIDCPRLQHAYSPGQGDIGDCARQLGASAWYYRSADAADDVAAVIRALQLSPVDYYGDSYATWFGQVLSVTHPGLLRTMVLDSAYPVLGDTFVTEVDHGQRAMAIACARSRPCRDLENSGQGTAKTRFAALLAALRANPVSGKAPGANGEMRHVTADPAALFLIIANAGNTPVTWRDLDAAGRALMENGDAQPLLRLVAEARDSYSGGGAYREFSVGLATAVQCAEYGNLFDLTAPDAARHRQYRAALNQLRTHHPNTYAPFTIDDAVDSQMDSQGFDLCLTWPAPPPGVTQAQPIPPGAAFPTLPVLVLSGELDTITSPAEGRAAAALFPNATFLEPPNTIHEGTIGDGGVFVPPNGQDLSECIGPIVRQFIASGGSAGDTSCLAAIRPIRTVPLFATQYAQVAPAVADAGNAVDQDGLRLASAVAETVGDAVARYYVTTSGQGDGLRGGGFTLSHGNGGYTITLANEKWTQDVTVNGTIAWDQLRGSIAARVQFHTDGHHGTIAIAWDDRATEAVASLTGEVDGVALAAHRVAP
jgi:pimeloyl-ACP methyl ester carboxylesterase